MVLAIYVTLMALLAVFAVHRLYLTLLSLRRHRHTPEFHLDALRLPMVTVQLPIFNFNGTAGIWRVEAIATAGGWQDVTVTEVAMATGAALGR